MAKPKYKKKPKARPTCFIIMPISRPPAMAERYPDGPDHFKNILNSLFIPAVEAADFKPDPPAAKGSEIIQARIIKKLIAADMVLCDMSCLNANVFFEFGIRTALNKPVCVVKDTQSPDVAFDTSIIHYHEYQSPLYAHQTADEIAALTSHIKDTWKKNKKTNAMWQALGFQLTAQVAQPSGEPNDQVLQMLLGITNRLDSMEPRKLHAPKLQEPKLQAQESETFWFDLKHATKRFSDFIDDLTTITRNSGPREITRPSYTTATVAFMAPLSSNAIKEIVDLSRSCNAETTYRDLNGDMVVW